MSAPGAALERAYAHCEALTRGAAANFYYGIRLLPARKRGAMCATYAYARRVDDIGDGTLEPDRKRRELDAQARAVRELAAPSGGAPASDDPVMVALADASRRFSIPLDAALELIEGVRMDVEGPVFEREEQLLGYSRYVAGSIGRMCVAIFGARDGRQAARAPELADQIGVGMQITNILRDVREDAQLGRLYLPAEDLRRFGLIENGASASPQALLSKESPAR
ncbi:MAG: phytoene/squalene synthase family protein, partial [Solirubrobacterales bacterium]|nr:phytoene/squalene synthase family protein [Solirubrobacterales bacterium]